MCVGATLQCGYDGVVSVCRLDIHPQELATNSLSYFMVCMCKKYRGIVLAHLFIRALLVLMRVAVLESHMHQDQQHPYK